MRGMPVDRIDYNQAAVSAPRFRGALQSQSTRRDFLGATGAALAASSVPPFPSVGGVGEHGADAGSTIPLHRPLHLDGVHAYTDQVSVAVGAAIRFHVSS